LVESRQGKAALSGLKVLAISPNHNPAVGQYGDARWVILSAQIESRGATNSK
jgi:hypothetical protein